MPAMKKLIMNYRQNPILYWMIMPVLIYIILFNYIPMFGLTMAFQDYSLTKGCFWEQVYRI
jgi:putative aldouronate transport system permease protein